MNWPMKSAAWKYIPIVVALKVTIFCVCENPECEGESGGTALFIQMLSFLQGKLRIKKY